MSTDIRGHEALLHHAYLDFHTAPELCVWRLHTCSGYLPTYPPESPTLATVVALTGRLFFCCAKWRSVMIVPGQLKAERDPAERLSAVLRAVLLTQDGRSCRMLLTCAESVNVARRVPAALIRT